jgi:hypothetical protein
LVARRAACAAGSRLALIKVNAMADQTTSLTAHDVPDLDLPAALAVLGGAAIGGLAGFLFLTTAGNRVRRDVLTAAGALFDGFDTLLTTWDRVQHRPGRSGRDTTRPLRPAAGGE